MLRLRFQRLAARAGACGLLLAGAPAAAVNIDGRVTASAYAFEAAPTDSTTSTYVRSHAALRLRASDVGHRSLSAHTYLRGTTDLTESADNDPGLRVYSLYLRYDGDRVEARGGRQRVFAGVGYGTIDGARVDLSHPLVDLTLYGGALAPLDGDFVSSVYQGHLYGARLHSDRLAGIDLALSFADRERDPVAYADTGRWSGFTGQPEAIRRQLLGLEARRGFGRHALQGRLDYDLLDEGVRRGELSGRYALSTDLTVSAEWRHREPAVYQGSVLAVFAHDPYDEYGLRLHYRLSPRLAVGASAATVIYTDDDALRLGVTASVGHNLTLTYHRYQGYSGNSDGLSGQLFWALNRQLTLRGQLGLSSLERYEMDGFEALVTAMGGLTWRPSREFSLDTQLQGLHNPSYDADLRLLVRGSWRFRR